jgi:hypothetical protein
MLDEDLLAQLDEILRPLGHVPDPGEEYETPALRVLRYYRRPVRLHWLPGIGRALGLVAVIEEPLDLPFSSRSCRDLLDRLSRAVNTRFPPFGRRSGLAVGLTVVVLTSSPIQPEEDAVLASGLARPSRSRCVPLGLFRVNLEQEAVSWGLAAAPGELYPEPLAIAEALGETLCRFVPPIDWGSG